MSLRVVTVETCVATEDDILMASGPGGKHMALYEVSNHKHIITDEVIYRITSRVNHGIMQVIATHFLRHQLSVSSVYSSNIVAICVHLRKVKTTDD